MIPDYLHLLTIIIACRLEFTESLDILAMYSSEGEKVTFSESISTSAARGAVEKWLLQVQDVMAISLRDVIEQARDVSQCMHVCYIHSYGYK